MKKRLIIAASLLILLFIAGSLSILLFSCGLQKPLASSVSTNTPIPTKTTTATKTQARLLTKTQTRTNTPTKTIALTKTSTPSITSTQTPEETFTLTPTLGICEKEGENFEFSGYLSLLEGGYNLDASSYIIAFYFEKEGSDRIMVKIQGGNKKDSLYFDQRKPYIRNHFNAIIPWKTQGGVTIYKTANEVTITGVYITRNVNGINPDTGEYGKIAVCTPSIEAIN